MTDIDIPAEVIELRRRFEAAELACKHISDELPSGVALAEGTAVITDEQRERLDAARAERARIAEQLRGHPWWKTMPSRTKAEAAVRAAARSETETGT